MRVRMILPPTPQKMITTGATGMIPTAMTRITLVKARNLLLVGIRIRAVGATYLAVVVEVAMPAAKATMRVITAAARVIKSRIG
jgi:hypothetical protein